LNPEIMPDNDNVIRYHPIFPALSFVLLVMTAIPAKSTNIPQRKTAPCFHGQGNGSLSRKTSRAFEAGIYEPEVQ
jgi:hypothetical protein